MHQTLLQKARKNRKLALQKRTERDECRRSDAKSAEPNILQINQLDCVGRETAQPQLGRVQFRIRLATNPKKYAALIRDGRNVALIKLKRKSEYPDDRISSLNSSIRLAPAFFRSNRTAAFTAA